jgi:general secretion pathway protein G
LLLLASGSVVLGAIAAWTAPHIICHGSDMRRVKAQADLFAIEEALELYRVDHGAVPTTERTLNELVEAAPTDGEGYLDYLPVDPWGNPYQYVSDGRQYSIISFAADGSPGGTAENADVNIHSAWAERP